MTKFVLLEFGNTYNNPAKEISEKKRLHRNYGITTFKVVVKRITDPIMKMFARYHYEIYGKR